MKKRARGNRITKATRDAIGRLLQEGRTHKDIAAALDVSESSVLRVRNSLPAQPTNRRRRPAMFSCGHPRTENGRCVQCAALAAMERAGRQRRHYDDDPEPVSPFCAAAQQAAAGALDNDGTAHLNKTNA